MNQVAIESWPWRLERAIRRAPEQYFWVHRRWKTDAVTRKKAVKIAERRAA